MLRVLLSISIIFFSFSLYCETISFGYFENKSKQKEFDYLEEIFPNSFASAFIGTDFKIQKPRKVKTILEDENIKLPKKYKEDDLILISDETDSDYLIYGHYVPLKNYYIKLVISIYSADTHELFTFETTGKLETELFDFVDSLIVTLRNVLQTQIFYKETSIPDNSKFAIITNLNQAEQNYIYSTLLSNNYRITTTGSTDLINVTYDDSLNKFYEIVSSNSSFNSPIDNYIEKNTIFYYGSWENQKDFESKKDMVDNIKFYYNDFSKNQSELFKKYRKITGNTDYLLILNFNKKRTEVSIRCIDLKSNKLIWFEKNFDPFIAFTRSSLFKDFNLKSLFKLVLDKFKIKSDSIQ